MEETCVHRKLSLENVQQSQTTSIETARRPNKHLILNARSDIPSFMHEYE